MTNPTDGSAPSFCSPPRAAVAASVVGCPAVAQGRGPHIVDYRRRFCRRELRARTQAPRSAAASHARSSRMPSTPPAAEQCGDRRLARFAAQQFGYDALQRCRRRAVHASRRGCRCAGANRDAQRRREAVLRAAGGRAGHRFPLGRDAGLRRGGEPKPCRMSGPDGAQVAAAAPATRGDGRRRRRRHFGAGQSGALPARALRARQHDRALSQDQEAALESASCSTPRTASPCRSCSRMRGRSFIPGMIEWVGRLGRRQR